MLTSRLHKGQWTDIEFDYHKGHDGGYYSPPEWDQVDIRWAGQEGEEITLEDSERELLESDILEEMLDGRNYLTF